MYSFFRGEDTRNYLKEKMDTYRACVKVLRIEDNISSNAKICLKNFKKTDYNQFDNESM